MNAETLKRVFRAIAEGSPNDLNRVARSIVDAERQGGHSRLADELSAILASAPRTATVAARRIGTPSVSALPTSRRSHESLALLTPAAELEHHMVLAPEVEERFQRIEREYAARERLLVHGLKPRRSVLLYGPPGCGKSLGAKRLAWNTGLPLMKVRFDSLLSSYFGESAANLRTLFDAARDMPCVLLIDECDFIARSRAASRDVGEASRIVSSLLQLMEDYDAPGLLVATTNLEGSLDEALFRRFDDVFMVTPPGPAEIQQLLCITLSAMKISGRVDMHGVVVSLAGWPAAQVVRAARDAAKLAVLDNRDEIQASDLQRAIMSLRPGVPSSSGD
jgi:SpoVK/Ycf46/Vps4 family AAA+-type ATPase